MNQKLRRAAGKTGAVALVGLAASMSMGAVAWAATNAGSATISDTQGNPKSSGGTQEDWTIKLPSGAACTKDTASAAYHVYGYIVDNTNYPDPGTLSWDANGPVASNGGEAYPLVTNQGSPWVAQNTAPTTGQVINIPVFNYQFFSIDGRNGTAPLPAGVYNVGIACVTNTGQTDNFWNVQETFSANATDAGGETWTVAPASNVPEVPMAAVLPVSGAALMGGGLLVAKRRRQATAGAA